MAVASVTIVGVLALSTSTGRTRVVSDMSGLLLGVIGGLPGQGQEDVVQGGDVHAEGADPARAGVDLVQ
jgi:hypothetical protein